MRDFIAQYCHRNDDKVNDEMFTRAFDRPLVEYIIDTCKNLEVIPAIKLESWEYITDQTKIRTMIDKKLSKDPKIRNNKVLERLAQPNRTLYDLLVLHFRVQAKGRNVEVTRKVRILKQLKDGSYIRNGKKVMLLNQVVDNSTYVKGNVLNFKTTLYPIKLSVAKLKLKFIDGETVTVPYFKLDLFSKVTNPLLYYMAQYGLEGTIEKFNLETVMTVVDDIIDEDHYMYIPICNNLYIEIHEKAFYAHEFISKFVATLYDAMVSDKTNITLKQAYDKEYWKGRLAEVFSKKRNPEKGERVLMSYEKMMDPSSKKRLTSLRKRHRRNTFTIIRWMMVNYEQLLKKDSNDLRYKRVRSNEVLAYFFDNYITRNVYSLLNTDNPPFEKYIRTLNSINENTLIRATQSGGKSSPTSMFRYERYNDFDAIELARYTLKGPTGLNGGKHKTSLRYRDIYVSQYGRYDLDVCSSSDPGLTGYLTSNVKLDKNGYFDSTMTEPDEYDPVIDQITAKYGDDEYTKKRLNYIRFQLNRGKDGYVHLSRKKTRDEIVAIFWEDPDKYGMYRSGEYLKLKPKITNRDPKGYIILTPKTDGGMGKYQRDKDGYIHLHRVTTKMDAKNKK